MSSDIIPRRAEDHDVSDTRPPHQSVSSNLMVNNNNNNSGTPNKNNNNSNKHKNSNDDDLCLSATYTNANSSKRPDMKSMTEEFHDHHRTKQNSPRTDESSLKTDNRDENNNNNINHSSTAFAAPRVVPLSQGGHGSKQKVGSRRHQTGGRIGIKRVANNPSSEGMSLSNTTRHNSNSNLNNNNNNNVTDECSSQCTNNNNNHNRSSTNKHCYCESDHPLFAAVAEQKNNANVTDFLDQVDNLKKKMGTSATESDENDLHQPNEAKETKNDDNGCAVSSPFPLEANQPYSSNNNNNYNTKNTDNQSLLLHSSASPAHLNVNNAPIHRRVGLLPRSATMIHALSQKLKAVMLAPAGMMVSENAEIMMRLSEAGVVIPLVEDQITEQEQCRRRLRREKQKKMLQDQHEEEEAEEQRKNVTTLSPQQEEQIRTHSVTSQSQEKTQQRKNQEEQTSGRKEMLLLAPSGLLQRANSSLIRKTPSNVDVQNNNNNGTDRDKSSTSQIKPAITPVRAPSSSSPSPTSAFVTVSARFPYAGGVSVMLTSRVGRVLPRTIVLQETVLCDITNSFLRQDTQEKETTNENQFHQNHNNFNNNNNINRDHNNILQLVGPSPSVFDHVQRVHAADGSYRKLVKLGAGSYGEVWLVSWSSFLKPETSKPSPLFPKTESPDRCEVDNNKNNNQSRCSPKKRRSSSPTKRRKNCQPLATASAFKKKKGEAEVVDIEDDLEKNNNKDGSNELAAAAAAAQVVAGSSSSRKTPSTLRIPVANPFSTRHQSPDAAQFRLQMLMQSVPQMQPDGDEMSFLERNALLTSNPQTNADTNSNNLVGFAQHHTNSTVIPTATSKIAFASKNETPLDVATNHQVAELPLDHDNKNNRSNHSDADAIIVSRRNVKELSATDINEKNATQGNEKQTQNLQNNVAPPDRTSPSRTKKMRVNNNNNIRQSPTFSRKLFASLFYSAKATNELQKKSPSPFRIRNRSSPIILQSKSNNNNKQIHNIDLQKRKVSPPLWARRSENIKDVNNKFSQRATSGLYPIHAGSRSSITFAPDPQQQQQQQDASIIAEENKNKSNTKDTVVVDEKFALQQLQKRKEQNYLVAQLGLSLDSTAAAFNGNNRNDVGMNDNNNGDNSNGYVKQQSAERKFSVTSDKSNTNMRSSPLFPPGATATTMKTKTDDENNNNSINTNNNNNNKRDSSSVQATTNNFCCLGGLESHCGHVSSLACTRPLISLGGQEMFKREVIAVCKIEIISSKKTNNNNDTDSPAKIKRSNLVYFDDDDDNDNENEINFNNINKKSGTNDGNDEPKIVRRFGDKSNDEDDDYLHQLRDVYNRPGTRLSTGVGQLSAARMDNEADILSNLAYPGIIGFIDKFTLDGKRHLVLEFVDGGDLEGELKRRRQLIQLHEQQQKQQDRLSSGSRFDRNRFQHASSVAASPLARPLNEDSILFLFAQILMALEYLHRNNIMHRDLKCANLLLSKKWQVKLTDFGLARRFNEDIDNAVMRKLCGTPTNLSPCIILNRQASEKADIWAAGCVLYELVTVGMQPFPGATVDDVVRAILNCEPVPIATHRAGVSLPLTNIVASCLNKTPTMRPSAKQLLQLPIVQRAMAEYVRRFKTAAMAITGTPLDAVWAKVVEEHQAMILRDGKAKVASQRAKRLDDRARSRETRTRQFTDAVKQSFRAAEISHNTFNNNNNTIDKRNPRGEEEVSPQSRSSLSMNKKINNNNNNNNNSLVRPESGNFDQYIISSIRRKHSLDQNGLYASPRVRRTALSQNNHQSNNRNIDDDEDNDMLNDLNGNNNNNNNKEHHHENSAERSGGAFVAVSSSLALLEAALTSVNGGGSKTSHGCGGTVGGGAAASSFPAIERDRDQQK